MDTFAVAHGVQREEAELLALGNAIEFHTAERMSELHVQKLMLEQDLEVCKRHERELRCYIFKTMRCVTTEALLRDMPRELADWLTAEWPSDDAQ